MVKCEVNVLDDPTPREEIKYWDEDLEIVKDEKPEDAELTEDDSDPEKPEEGEFEYQELERRLKRNGLVTAAEALNA